MPHLLNHISPSVCIHQAFVVTPPFQTEQANILNERYPKSKHAKINCLYMMTNYQDKWNNNGNKSC